MSAMTLESEREAFEKWASEYGFTQFDITSTGAYRAFVSRSLFDAFRAGAHLAQPAQSVDVDSWTGEIECCDAKGFWLILADDCPFVPGQKVTITAALQEKGNGAG